MKFPKGITACPRPKMTNHRGRTWDQCTVILPDGSKVTGYFDTTWGFYFYFEAEGRWRKGDIHKFDTMASSWNITPDLRTSNDDLRVTRSGTVVA